MTCKPEPVGTQNCFNFMHHCEKLPTVVTKALHASHAHTTFSAAEQRQHALVAVNMSTETVPVLAATLKKHYLRLLDTSMKLRGHAMSAFCHKHDTYSFIRLDSPVYTVGNLRIRGLLAIKRRCRRSKRARTRPRLQGFSNTINAITGTGGAQTAQ